MKVVVCAVAGALSILAGLGALANAIAGWTVTHVCGGVGRDHFCTATGPGSDLSMSPWAYLALAVGLFVLAGLCLSAAGVTDGPLSTALRRRR